MLQVETDAVKASFTDAVGRHGDSEANEHFSTEDENESKIETETLISLHVAPGAKRCKNISALLDIGALESLLAL